MTFGDWIPLQRQRTDRVGELARQLVHDEMGPLWAIEPDAYRHYLQARGADKSMCDTLEIALAEWAKGQDQSGKSWLRPA